MDEIARHIGVSKTVLYRYFTDKNDLGVATTVRFFETTLMPRLIETITDDVDEYTLTRTVISVYVHAVADEPALYRFALSASPSSSVTSAESEKLVAQLLTSTIVMRLGERDGDAAGARCGPTPSSAVSSAPSIGGWVNDPSASTISSTT